MSRFLKIVFWGFSLWSVILLSLYNRVGDLKITEWYRDHLSSSTQTSRKLVLDFTFSNGIYNYLAGTVSTEIPTYTILDKKRGKNYLLIAPPVTSTEVSQVMGRTIIYNDLLIELEKTEDSSIKYKYNICFIFRNQEVNIFGAALPCEYKSINEYIRELEGLVNNGIIGSRKRFNYCKDRISYSTDDKLCVEGEMYLENGMFIGTTKGVVDKFFSYQRTRDDLHLRLAGNLKDTIFISPEEEYAIDSVLNLCN